MPPEYKTEIYIHVLIFQVEFQQATFRCLPLEEKTRHFAFNLALVSINTEFHKIPSWEYVTRMKQQFVTRHRC